jgi:pimeloyl-ACP methyl ester carboxylesterase
VCVPIKGGRPGYGGSTRLSGRGIGGVADDLVQLLDHLGLDGVPVMGGSMIEVWASRSDTAGVVNRFWTCR